MDIFNMFGKLKEVQAKVKEAQESLLQISLTAESGAGLVKATVNGKKQVIKIDIDPSLCKIEDREMLQDLVAAAVNKALELVEEKAAEVMQKATNGLIPNIPGFDIFGK